MIEHAELIERLRAAARDALLDFTKECLEGKMPDFPQWAKDALDVCNLIDGKRAYTSVDAPLVHRQSNAALLRGAPCVCYWATGCGDSTRCKEAGSCVAARQNCDAGKVSG